MTNSIVGVVLLLIAAVFAVPIISQVAAVALSVRDRVRAWNQRRNQ